MNIGDNINAVYGIWKMHCPTPRAYRWIKNHLKNLDSK